MREPFTAAGCAIVAVLLALALVPRSAAAQSSPHDAFERNSAPPEVLNFGAGPVRSLNDEFEVDFYVLGAFGGKRRLDRFASNSLPERPTPWRFYGRLGVLNFQQQFDPRHSQGLHFSFRKTGPKLTGRVYVGIYRTFD